jgi:hypothetical protein
MLASSRVQTQLKPLDFSGKKILSMPSFRREVKPLVPCYRLAACKRSLNGVEKALFWQNYHTPLTPTVPPFAARSTCIVGDMEAYGGKSGNVLRQGKAMANYP